MSDTTNIIMSDAMVSGPASSSESALSSADSSLIHPNDIPGAADTLSTTISVLEQRLAEKGMDWADIWETEQTTNTMEDQVQVMVDGSISSPAGLADDERTAQDTTSGIAKELGNGEANGEYVTSTVVFKKPQRPVLFLQTIFTPPSPKPCAFVSSSHWVSSPSSSPIVLPPIKARRKRRSHVPSVMRVTNINTNAVPSPTLSTRSSTMTYIEVAQPPHVPLSPETVVRKLSVPTGVESRYGNLKTRAAERWGKLAVRWRARGRTRSVEVEKTGSWKIE